MCRLLLFVSMMIQMAFAGENCSYGHLWSCPKNHHCVKTNVGKSVCNKDIAPVATLSFPFLKNIKIKCDQGNLPSGDNSHSWLNTAFALDLQANDPHEKIYSSTSGRVIVHDACTTKNDNCGLGFGNQVKVLGDDGVLVFYAHLASVNLKTGDRVSIGDPLGTQGMTGLSGVKNYHLHLSVHYDWRKQTFSYWKNPGFLPASVPFYLSVCADCQKGCTQRPIDSRSLKCRRSGASLSPLCKVQ